MVKQKIKCFHMEMFISCIYKVLWHLLHRLVSLYEYCMWLRLRIIAIALWSYDRCRRTSTAEKQQNEYDFLRQCKKHLNKIPKHLNLVIGPDNMQANDDLVKRIFSYALHMNINCISYYDTRYTNPSSSKFCLTALEKFECPKGWKRKNIDAHHTVWYVSDEKAVNGTSHVNGLTNSALTNDHLPKSNSSVQAKSTSLEVNYI